MRSSFDLTPLVRTGVGFDRMLDAIQSATEARSVYSWPPYNIIKSGEDTYRIEMALAGFTDEELTITQDRNVLIVTGEKDTSDEANSDLLHHGIAWRPFERRFNLADHVSVTGARLNNGLLTVELKQEIPEALKPRQIEIMREDEVPALPKGDGTPQAARDPETVEAGKAEADKAAA